MSGISMRRTQSGFSYAEKLDKIEGYGLKSRVFPPFGPTALESVGKVQHRLRPGFEFADLKAGAVQENLLLPLRRSIGRFGILNSN